MKEENLKRIRERKAKREQRAEGFIQSIDLQKEFEQLAEIMPSVGEKPHALLDFGHDLDDKSGMPGNCVVTKDGKLMLNTELMEQGNNDRKDKLTLVDDSKTQTLTSMLFRKKNHRKQWSPEETEKWYKVSLD